jgi:hypothetical protein
MTIYSDYQDYFKNTTPGTTSNWAGGSLSMGQGGNATYTDPLGTTLNFNQNTPLTDLYKNPFIADLWGSVYDPTTINALNSQSAASNAGNFTVPTDLFPYSQSTSSSSSNQQSHSGINWDSPFMKELTPVLKDQATKLPEMAANIGNTLNDQYSNLMRNAMNSNAFQGVLNSLSNKGMLNSSIAQNTLASAGKTIAQQVADKAFESLLEQQKLQLTVPSILAQIATLGQESDSSGSSSSSSSSYSANPLAPYELMAQMMMY